MITAQIRIGIMVSGIVMNLIAMQAMAADQTHGSDHVYARRDIKGQEFTGQILHCKVQGKSGDKEVLRILLAPHTPKDQGTQRLAEYHRLDHAEYAVKSDRIKLSDLNHNE